MILTDAEYSQKDPELRGIYVKRCKCGARPYFDRIDPWLLSRGCWIQCPCGRTGESGSTKQEAIDNWNNNFMSYRQYY